jgi:hypothetical protein
VISNVYVSLILGGTLSKAKSNTPKEGGRDVTFKSSPFVQFGTIGSRHGKDGQSDTIGKEKIRHGGRAGPSHAVLSESKRFKNGEQRYKVPHNEEIKETRPILFVLFGIISPTEDWSTTRTSV